MKGIILAGGTGSRLAPLTTATNKSLLPIGPWPMIWHPIKKLQHVGIQEIMIVTSRDHMGDVVRCLGSGAELGVQLTYRVQDEAGGIAQALGLCGSWAGVDDVLVILGDNIFEDDLSSWLSGAGCCLWLKKVTDPSRFGVARLDPEDNGKLIGIVEKPTDWVGPGFAVTGIYGYDHRVWDIIRKLTPSARGELEITDVNNAYIAMGEVEYRILKGWWTDAGTPESYVRANALVNTGGGRLKEGGTIG